MDGTLPRDEHEVTRTSPSGHTFARDHVQIDLGMPSFAGIVFGTVPEALADVPNPGFLEFRAGPEGLPDKDTRHSVQRALEFLVGGPLAEIGWSKFDLEGKLVETGLSSSNRQSRGPSILPGLLDPKTLNTVGEKVVHDFLRNYLLLRKDYDLNRAIWLFLSAQDATLDMASAYVGAAFEILVRGYYALPENEKRARRLPKAQWKAISKSIRSLLDDSSKREELQGMAEEFAEIKQRLGNLNLVSQTKLNQLFLSDLGLDHSKTEEDALLSRNDAAHGNKLEPDDYRKTLLNYRGLHTLFARCLFRLLNVETPYIDYSTEGHPDRHLTTRQGTS